MVWFREVPLYIGKTHSFRERESLREGGGIQREGGREEGRRGREVRVSNPSFNPQSQAIGSYRVWPTAD